MTTLIRREALMTLKDSAAQSDSRVRRFVASNEAVDSYNTVIKADGWVMERFTRNPVIQLFHSGSRFPIGKGAAAVEGKQLVVSIEFAPADDPVSGPDAEQALRWIDRGVLGVSVGFDPIEYEYDESRETGDEWRDMFFPPINYTKQELYEISVVNVPANPDALPMGRSVAQRSVSRFIERSAAKVAAATPVVKAPETKAPAGVSRDQFIKLLSTNITNEVRAAIARQTGKLGG
jgi:HK97 family phage prohead protease